MAEVIEALGGLSTIGPVGSLTLFVLALLAGWLFPRATMKRAWAEQEISHTENRELLAALTTQADQLGKIADQVADLKTASQATLYAMQEIQAAGRYAAGMTPLPRTVRQDGE